MKGFLVGNILLPIQEGGDNRKKDNDLISEAERILHINRESDLLVMIPITPRVSQEKNKDKRSAHKKRYFVAPRTYSLKEVIKKINEKPPVLAVNRIKNRPITTLSDEELDKRYGGGSEKSCTSSSVRSTRWETIKPLVEGDKSYQLFDADKRPIVIRNHIATLGVAEAESKRLYRNINAILNQYWAGGSTREALTPFFENCGKVQNGRRRNYQRKPGPRNAQTKAGLEGVEGLILSEIDIKNIEFSWRNFVIKENTVEDGLRSMWNTFYSNFLQKDDGEIEIEWLPSHLRPTRAQFEHHGRKENPNHTAWLVNLHPNEYEKNYRPLTADNSNELVMVGQRGSIDGTSTDTQFVSICNPLKRIGLSNRILKADSLTGYIPGFYMGLLPPSSATVAMALLNCVDEKDEWLEDLGLTHLNPEAWIPMNFSALRADNTDCRTEAIMELCKTVGTDLEYVSVNRADENYPAETSHHILHRLSDHKLLGSTYGRKTERGEVDAKTRARHTLLDGIRETVRAQYYHNTRELDPTVLTLKMRKDGIRPTRFEIVKWYQEQGMLARAALDPVEARAKLLLTCRGVFTPQGVRLLRDDRGSKKEFVDGLLYRSIHPTIARMLEWARKPGSMRPGPLEDEFRYDINRLRHIYYRDPQSFELVELNLITKDGDLVNSATFSDMVTITDQNTLERSTTLENDRRLGNQLDLEREAMKEEAEKDYSEALEKGAQEYGKVPSNKELVGNVIQNRENELGLTFGGVPVIATSPIEETINETVEDEPPLENEEQENSSEIVDPVLEAMQKRYSKGE